MNSEVRIPSYCLHKQSGRAYVTIGGRQIGLGKYGTPESIAKYERAIAEYLAGVPQDDAATVVELLAAYLDHAEVYYRKDGQPTSELNTVRTVIRRVRKLYGNLDCDQFRPKHIKALQAAWVRDGVARGTVNKYVGKVNRMFKWGVSEEYVRPETFTALSTVESLKKGRSEAPDRKPVEPVEMTTVEATLPFCSPKVQAMIWLQLYTGARPGEIRGLMPDNIDRSDDPWVYTVDGHKTSHHGKRRIIYLGPQAQAALKPFLFQTLPFRYTMQGYINHIHTACKRARVERWNPNQLRHTRGTEIRATHGLEAAQHVLGHSKTDMTETYAERNLELARKVARETG